MNTMQENKFVLSIVYIHICTLQMNRLLAHEFLMNLISKNTIKLSNVVKSIAQSHPLQSYFGRNKKINDGVNEMRIHHMEIKLSM